MAKMLQKIAYVKCQKNGSIYLVRLLDDDLKIGQMVKLYNDQDRLYYKKIIIAKVIRFGVESCNVNYRAQAMLGAKEDFINKMEVVDSKLTFSLKNELSRRWILEKKVSPTNDFLSQDKLIVFLLSKNFIEINPTNRNYLSSYIKFNGVQRVVFSFRRRGVDFCVLNGVSGPDVDFSNNVLFSVRYNYQFENERIHKIIISLCSEFDSKKVLNAHYFIQKGYFKNNERFFSLSSNSFAIEKEIKKFSDSSPVKSAKVIDEFECNTWGID